MARNKRKSIPVKLRFEVFKRDDFVCQYCGNTPPEVILEADHIIPKSEGGIDDLNNLTTSCFSCNRGKGKVALDVLPATTIENLNVLKEKQKQTKRYYKFIEEIENQKAEDLKEIGYHFFNHFQKTKRTLNRYFFAGSPELSIKMFLKTFNKYQIMEAIDIAILRLRNRGRCTESGVFKYMCGILHNWRKNGKPGSQRADT